MFCKEEKMKIYLDNAATTPIKPEVLKAMLPYLKDKFQNPSSIYSSVNKVREEIDKARKILANAINAEANEIIFTSGGTESNNIVLKGFNATKILVSEIEHPAVLETSKASGKQIEIIPVDKQGIVNLDVLKQKIVPNSLVSVMHVNNEIGTIQPIEEIAKICRQKNAFFHTDAVQSFGKLDIDIKKLNIDFLSASAHKIHGPKGIGILYIRKELQDKLEPLIHGGGQEFGLRSGTENVAGILGFAQAVKLCSKKTKCEQIKKLRDKLVKEILKIPGTRLNGSKESRIFNNANFTIKGIEGEALVTLLDHEGIACSTGSACSTHSHKASHVLVALGLNDREAHSSLRITLGCQNTEKEINYTINKIQESVKKLRKLSGEGKW
jgi:cysteine desulfurase